jgi:hypothetical protein
MGNNNYVFHPEFNIPYTNTKIGLYEGTILKLDYGLRSQKITNEATAYPPLYYEIGALAYKLVYNKDIIIRVYSVRLVNIFLFLLLVYFIYQCGRLLFPNQILYQLSLLISVGFHPMLSFLAGGVNSDNLFNLLVTVHIYLCLRLLNKAWTWKVLLLVVGMLLITLWTKPQAKIIPLFYLYPFFLIIFKNKKQILPYFALILLGLLAFRSTLYQLFTKQQFIPEVGAMSELNKLSVISFIDFIKSSLIHTYKEVMPWYWGIYRWLSLTYPRIIHRFINYFVLISSVGIIMYIYKQVIKNKNALTGKNIKSVGFLLYVAAIYFFALMIFDYLFTLSHGFSLGMQGRYYFPTIVAHIALLLIGFITIAELIKTTNQLLKVYMVLVIALHIYAFTFVTSSYYGKINLNQFFLLASQYKPFIFKSPFLEIIYLFSMLTCGTLIITILKSKRHSNEKVRI